MDRNIKNIIVVVILVIIFVIVLRSCLRTKEVEIKQTDKKFSVEVEKENN